MTLALDEHCLLKTCIQTTKRTATTGQEAFNELRKIIDENKAYLIPQCVPEINSAFNSVQEAHKTMKEDCDDLIILAGKIKDYTHYFRKKEKRKIEECFKQMLTHEGMCQINKKRRISEINVVEVDSGAKLSITESVVIIKDKNSTGLTVNINNFPVFDDYFEKKDAKIVEASKSSIKLLVRFASQQAMKKFEMECDSGITEKEIYELLLKNKLIEPGAEIKVTVKTGHGALLIISMEEFEKVNKESIDLVPFMVAAYNCKNMKQLDSNLASMLEKRITASDLQSRYHTDQEQTTGKCFIFNIPHQFYCQQQSLFSNLSFLI
ncbi:uncharacterized protein LOC117122828 [Anneissia japonica]|uniref:uncharacterized protein LOC117122828 n=1 Tax=Anneissia japonica TaxID=1529436 RepID=UPI00142562BC|nr:uncharacterized protein LOC117122828 [Anneissia japonica]